MEQLLEILEDMKPNIDFETCETLIDDGLLDSFDIISLVTELSEAFDVEISPVDIVPDNFNSAASLWVMVERLKDN